MASLYFYLVHLPNVGESLYKEIRYFDLHHGCGANWYRSRFQFRNRATLGINASPYSLQHPLAREHSHRLLPDATLIALLRIPADRAFSQHHKNRRHGREELSFREALDREEERTSDTRGLGPYTRNQIARAARDRASYEAVSYNRRVSPAIARITEWHDCNGPGFAGEQDLSAHRGAESGSSRAVHTAQPARDLPTRTLRRTSDA